VGPAATSTGSSPARAQGAPTRSSSRWRGTTSGKAERGRGALAVLIDELRTLPDGLASRVRADLLLADVLRALRWPEGAIAAALADGEARRRWRGG
jgi:hypothetical protein